MSKKAIIKLILVCAPLILGLVALYQNRFEWFVIFDLLSYTTEMKFDISDLQQNIFKLNKTLDANTSDNK